MLKSKLKFNTPVTNKSKILNTFLILIDKGKWKYSRRSFSLVNISVSYPLACFTQYMCMFLSSGKAQTSPHWNSSAKRHQRIDGLAYISYARHVQIFARRSVQTVL